jgi:outer membrane protein assembly factor BamB
MAMIGGTAPSPGNEGNIRPGGAFQHTPVVNDGFMYIHNPWGEVMKFDVSSGSRARGVWFNDPEMEIVGANRGSPVLLNEFVYNKTRDMRLFKIDDASGETIWEVTTEVVYDVDPILKQSTSDAALAVADKIIVPQVSRQRRGWIGAFSAEDGSHLWHFNTIPRPGEFGHETWADD